MIENKTFHAVKDSVVVRCDSFKEGHYYKFIPFYSNCLGSGKLWVKEIKGKRKYFYQDLMGRVTIWNPWQTTRFAEVN